MELPPTLSFIHLPKYGNTCSQYSYVEWTIPLNEVQHKVDNFYPDFSRGEKSKH